MRRLGEVTGFRVRLRKREVRRIEAAASRTSQAPDIASGPAASCDPNSTSTSNSSANKKKPKFKQKRPAVPAPVPKWLIQWIAQREDRMLSFDEVVNLVKMIQRHIENVVLGPNEEVRFPDIEILPSLVDRSSLPSVNSPETSSHCIPGSGFGGERGQDQGPGNSRVCTPSRQTATTDQYQ
ncbi:hypothetical protein BJX63DRAFT_396866 [Aspergillus granulosus]|uniref:Uncharacterized protein n=1 Tax=Aspergillus granulosus TaxID=176169 RepID=A0ABR4HAA8_9EURO